MARHSAALTSLCNCLRGMPPVDVEWTPVIGLANQTLTTPALIDLVDKFASMLPEDVCTYIRQGGIDTGDAPEERRGVRLMSDLDIMIMPDEARTAAAALCAIGYDIDYQAPSESQRWHVELNRSQDVGTIDLQRAAPGPAYLYQSFGHALNHCVPAPLGRGTRLYPQAYLPSAHVDHP